MKIIESLSTTKTRELHFSEIGLFCVLTTLGDRRMRVHHGVPPIMVTVAQKSKMASEAMHLPGTNWLSVLRIAKSDLRIIRDASTALSELRPFKRDLQGFVCAAQHHSARQTGIFMKKVA